MNILGISCYYHDAAACLIKDGKVIAAAEEERFSRKKHDSSFPKYALDFCLKQGKISNQELDYVVFYEKPFRKFHRILISSFSAFPLSYASFIEAMRIWLKQKLWIKNDLASYLKIDPASILFCEHHLSHAASAYYPSPFSKAAILTVDGVGEWATASFGLGEGNKITLYSELHFPQSLGLLYSAFTAFLGFEVNEGEWKVMGLAPYGKPKFIDKVWKVVKMHPDGSFSLDLSFFSFHYSDKYSFSNKFIKLFGEPIPPDKSSQVSVRAADIAASIQLVTEEILLSMAKNLRKKTNSDNLCLAGGVALNSRANYKILKESGFKNIFIQPACGDSGGALGAALYLYHHVLNKRSRMVLTDAYLGQEWDNEAIEKFLAANNTRAMWQKLNDKELVDFITDQIIKEKVVGWFQGRFEWGPRALGNRSILADARNPIMKDKINQKVKFRESFRPFAPSVLAEYADKVFDIPPIRDASPLRFMLYVVPVKDQWRKKVPAINHVDNTARPQVVFGNENALFCQLLKTFYQKTGVPLVLNTSFNLQGEPIVASPSDAYSTFKRSGIDILVMGNYVCKK